MSAADTIADAGLDARGAAWVKCFREAWASGDMDRLLAPLRPEASVLYPLMQAQLDREGLRGFFARMYQRLPDLRIEPLTWAQRGDDVLIVWRATATVAGAALTWEGADWFTLDREGWVVRARAYYDPRELLAGFGAG